MSMPSFPTINPPLTREDAINQIISSIAMEELGLSHIINAEGEKLQYVLGTLSGQAAPEPGATIEDVLKVNESIRLVLQSAAETQTMLRAKLQTALSSAVLTGPTGPIGPTGPTGPGAVLSFSTSENELTLNTATAANNAVPWLVGMGNAFDYGEAVSDTIDMSQTPIFDYPVPRGGTIGEFYVYFTFIDAITLAPGATAKVFARLYQNTTKDNAFTFIGTSNLELTPEITEATTPSSVLSGHVNVGAAVTPGTRLLLVLYAVGSAADVKILGYASAGLEIV